MPSPLPETPGLAGAERGRSLDSGVARMRRAEAVRARAEALREERRLGLALYVLDRARAEGVPGVGEFAATLRREFAEANSLTVWLAPPEVKAEDGGAGQTGAGLRALGADLAATLHDGLALAVPGIVTFAGGQRSVELKPAAMPQLVVRVEPDSISDRDSLGSALGPPETDPAPIPNPTTHALRVVVEWDGGAGTGAGEPAILLQLRATLGSGADAEPGARVRGEEAALAALRADLRGQLRARMPELLVAFAEASLAVLRARRAPENAEEPPGDLEWGWFAVWAEAGLPLPQVDAERAARRALALPEAQPVEGS